MAPASKAQQKAVSKYMKNNYDEIKLRIPKGKKQVIQDEAQRQEESTNGYIKKAVQAKYKGDTGQELDL